MMGERTGMQEALFYGFSVEQHVPQSHVLRAIDRFVDLSGLRAHLSPFYSHTGRPSIDPELLIRMLIIGYCMGIRSERALMRGGASQSRLSMVLPAGPGRCGSRSLDLFQEPARPVP